ncbi:cytochrome-c peroxidase [Chitinophaga rhizophila]|uniref:Cytochrome C peroxidase n=1 Tax=Chitinophaga rhizophila TaxID=2866212 RepID=A0ABS7GH42_9BACT|nr:cytochrome c peroxidase [Chitinophaga rhizophila]MBW8687023.1 cytochrome C peroxidase [Chitinophaga rhizophila]
MRKFVFLAAASIFTWLACTNRQSSIATLDNTIHNWLTLHLDSLEAEAEHLQALVAARAPEPELKTVFRDCRRLYKQLEWFSAYYAPATSRQLNGPPLPEIEVEENKASDPAGLQVIEELLFPYDTSLHKALQKEAKGLVSSLIPLRHTVENTRFDTAHVFDACKMEVFRTATQGITGFDTPLSGWGLTETGVALQAVRDVMQLTGAPDSLLLRFDSTIAATGKVAPDGGFDYAQLLVSHLNPLSAAMTDWFYAEGLQPIKYPQALKNTARTLFDSGAFNTAYFVHNADAAPTPDKVALGEMLFYDNRLAGNGRRNCSSCHVPEKAFTDGLPKNVSLDGGATVLRNTPTLLYAGLQQAQFYDMRSPTLENQVLDVLHNEAEMHSSPERVSAWLNQDTALKSRFKGAFPDMQDSILPRHVMRAIAAYIRELHPFRSDFDRYMRGEQTALTAQQKKGLNLFIGKARCATCHFMPLFNGTAAPSFATTESEVLGVLKAPGAKELDPDMGRYIHTKLDELKYAFKTPTLRNISLTAPYMHNGAYRTLEEVMEFYNKGGAAGYGIVVPGQTLSADSLQLSSAEIAAVIDFMGALTDR